MSLKPAIIVTGSIVAIAVAGLALRAGAPQAAKGAAQDGPTVITSKAEAAALQRKALRLNEACRGGEGADNGAAACTDRDRIMAQLAEQGVCWGNESQIGPERTWQACDNAPTASVSPKRSALYDLAHPEARNPPSEPAQALSTQPNEPSDAVSYSQKKWGENVMDAIDRSNIEYCIDNVVQVALNAGMKSRNQIGDYVASYCAGPIQTAYPELSDAAARAGAKQMALGRIEVFARRGQ